MKTRLRKGVTLLMMLMMLLVQMAAPVGGHHFAHAEPPCDRQHQPGFPPHLGPCGWHHTCQTLDRYYDHDECYDCGRYLCDGSRHDYCCDCGYAICNPEQKHTVCGEYVCSSNADSHGDGVCGMVLTTGVHTFGREILPVCPGDPLLTLLPLAPPDWMMYN